MQNPPIIPTAVRTAMIAGAQARAFSGWAGALAGAGVGSLGVLLLFADGRASLSEFGRWLDR